MEFLLYLFLGLLIYWILKAVMLFLRFRNAIKDFQQKARDAAGQGPDSSNSANSSATSSSSTSSSSSSNAKKIIPKEEGEYVDFEEVE